MIKFVWDDDESIGHHECTMYDDNVELKTIYFYDYSNPFQVEDSKQYRHTREYAYVVGYCHGFSMTKAFDRSEDPDSYEYVGKPQHSIDDIKRWCENYLASGYIREYQRIQEQFDTIKERAEQLLKMGYVSDNDIDI